MLIAKRTLTHIGELDSAFGASVHEPVAALGVKLGSGDDFGQLLHVRGLDVHDVETLILYVQVPQVDAQIVTADEGLAIAVYRYAVDVVGVSVGISSTGHGSNDSIVMCEAWELKISGVLEL